MASLWGPSCILLSGKAGAGKDTVAQYLYDEYGYEKLSFAEPIRRMLTALMDYQGVSYKHQQRYFNDREFKEAPSNCLGGISPRRAMQTLGSEWGREFLGDHFWAYVGVDKAVRCNDVGYRVVFTDTRFPEEVSVFKDTIATSKWVQVANPRVKKVEEHMSEMGLDHMKSDDILINEGSFEDLYSNIDNMMEKYCVAS